MLIDAAHKEQTRVVVEENGQILEYDFSTITKHQAKGNVYLAKVTRVEPSLQAAFVEYDDGKQGFLSLSEIHPDYYHIPVEDRAESTEEVEDEPIEPDDTKDVLEDFDLATDEEEEVEELEAEDVTEGDEEEEIQTSAKKRRFKRRYKIHEVIKRNQILLLQVIKEERGNKGATLSTYISLAGRYCVLMPNTEGGGGISRRIVRVEDRKKLKIIVDEFAVPEGMSVIVRTAGGSRTKSELKKDYEYLMKLWNSIRSDAISSTAPSLIYEEGNVVKKSIRDLYDNDISSVLIEGEEAFLAAKEFMKTLVLGKSAKIKRYKGNAPIFYEYGIEEKLLTLYEPIAQLPSGGYVVMTPTEALVSIDVNSGRSTGERSVESTAIKTNLEAAYEIARQLRLRDLSGLIVIDFIDMFQYRNRRAVERAVREAFKGDRAKVQIGRISPFGLMEMSRQRVKPNITEMSMCTCPYCKGLGSVTTPQTRGFHALRRIENELSENSNCKNITAIVPRDVALYLLNDRRDILISLEQNLNAKITIRGDITVGCDELRIEIPEDEASPKKKRRRKKSPAKKSRKKQEEDATIKDMVVEPDLFEKAGNSEVEENSDKDKKSVKKERKPVAKKEKSEPKPKKSAIKSIRGWYAESGTEEELSQVEESSEKIKTEKEPVLEDKPKKSPKKLRKKNASDKPEKHSAEKKSEESDTEIKRGWFRRKL